MEFFSLYSLFFLSILSLAFLFLLFHHQPCSGHRRLPPGRLGWLMVGEMWEFLSMRWKGHPEKFVLERLSKYAPSQVFKTSLFGEKTVVLCRASGNKFLFSNENKLVRSWWPVTVDKILPFNFHSSTYEESTKMRKIYSNFLNLEALQRYVPIMDTIAKRHFATEWEHRYEVEVYSLAKRFTFRLACRLFLSMDDPNHIDKLASLVKDIMAGFISIPIDLPGTQLHRGVKGSKLVREEIKAIIKLSNESETTHKNSLSNIRLEC